MRVLRMAVSEYRRNAFAGRAPSSMTIRRMIERGDLPGEKLGGQWFVLVDELGEPVRKISTRSTGNVGADQLLSQWINGAASGS